MGAYPPLRCGISYTYFVDLCAAKINVHRDNYYNYIMCVALAPLSLFSAACKFDWPIARTYLRVWISTEKLLCVNCITTNIRVMGILLYLSCEP